MIWFLLCQSCIILSLNDVAESWFFIFMCTCTCLAQLEYPDNYVCVFFLHLVCAIGDFGTIRRVLSKVGIM